MTRERGSDESLAEDLEPAADAANAVEVPVDWEVVGGVKLQAKAEAASGTLTRARADELLARAKTAIPKERRDVADELDTWLNALVSQVRPGH